MEMNWTDSQIKAIDATSDKVIVSAAAGSGKTGVLTQRVINLVKAKNDIRRMLIMTFTNAAAGEMKKRIIEALAEEASKAQREKLPSADYLFEQAETAENADISTFHSFCTELLRENFNLADISPNFKILSKNEAKALRHEAMRDVLDELYERRDPDLIRLLARYTSKFREEKLIEMLLDIYDKARSQPLKLKWITKSSEIPIEARKKRFCEIYKQKMNNDIETAIESVNAAAEIESFYEDPKASDHTKEIKALRNLLNTDLNNMYLILKDFKVTSAARKDSKLYNEAQDDLQKIKDYVETSRKALKAALQWGDPSLIEKELLHTDKDARAIAEIIEKFDDAYTEKKKERNGLDFDDTLIKTIEVLEQNHDIAQNFDYIFVDEYQDTNPVQEEIINLLKRDNPSVNLFMVGDMKQSIYRFRNADPSLFKGKADEYNTDGFEPIALNDNFRSCEVVINAVNGVMENLMSEEFGDVTYGEGERLVGRKEGGYTALLLGEVGSAEVKKYEEEGLSKKELKADIEAQAVADSIEQILTEYKSDGSKYEPSDIAILARSIKNNDVLKAIMKKLSEKGILYSLAKNPLSDTPEIELFVNLLKITDNPKNDVALVSVLKSDIGKFNDNELAEIHIAEAEEAEKYAASAENKGSEKSEDQGEYEESGNEETDNKENRHRNYRSFYGQLWNYKKNNKNTKLAKKIEEFLDMIYGLQLLAQTESLSDFVSSLRDNFNFDDDHKLVKNGNSKRSVFEKFMEYLREICAYSGNNLYRLISELEAEKKRSENNSYINIEEDDDIPAVSIMTMHKSKGLEFPVVFLVNLTGELSGRDVAAYRTTKEDGLVLPYRDEDTREKRDGIMLTAIKERLNRDDKSEYLRLLYVAMTRAKERLYMCGTVDKENIPYIDKEIDSNSSKIMLDWIITTDPQKYEIELIDTMKLYSSENESAEKPADEKDKIEKHIKELSKKEGAAMLITPVKPDGIPQKVSVSDIKDAQKEEKETRSYKVIGNYLKAAAGDGDKELSAATLGTLIHKLMEHILKYDLDTVETAEKMRENNLISEEEYDVVINNKYMADNFLNSDLYERMKKADRLLEEQRFLLNVPANKLGLHDNSEELVTVQGILDAAFLEDGEWVLIDYKTDKVDGKKLDSRANDYKIQLDLYSDALKEITGIPVKERYLYFLRTGELKAV